MLEHLERRRLFASSLVGGTLTVTGTTEDDRIALEVRTVVAGASTASRYFVFINDVQVATYSLESVSRIRINALEGDDHVSAGVVHVCHVEGSGGNDTLVGGSAHETLNGGNGHDLLVGGFGDDVLAGGAGRDRLAGDRGMAVEAPDGNDTLEGGPGDDILSGGGGADRYFGGGGSDTADYSDRADNVLISIGPIKLFPDWPVGHFGTPFATPDAYLANPNPQFDPRHYMGAGWLEGDLIETDVEHGRGGGGNDVLWGSDFDNRLEGGAGNDNLYGGLGADSLYGDAGNDRLFAADRTDAQPGFGLRTVIERVHGGGGNDYAMVDWSDPPLTSQVDRLEVLPFLTS